MGRVGQWVDMMKGSTWAVTVDNIQTDKLPFSTFARSHRSYTHSVPSIPIWFRSVSFHSIPELLMMRRRWRIIAPGLAALHSSAAATSAAGASGEGSGEGATGAATAATAATAASAASSSAGVAVRFLSASDALAVDCSLVSCLEPATHNSGAAAAAAPSLASLARHILVANVPRAYFPGRDHYPYPN